MNIQYANAVAGAFPPASGTLPGVLTKVGNGYIVVRPDNTILSVQPDGSYQPRAVVRDDKGQIIGTAGAWEVCQIDGGINVLRFRPDVDGTVIPYQVWFRAA